MAPRGNVPILKPEQDADNAAGEDDPASPESLQDSENSSDCEPEDYKLCLESGYGVRIVSSRGLEETGQRFRLNASALAQLVARAGEERPVVLVSVAGAFRGGKSFLLDFMLRYLYALAQADGEPLGEEWLGGEEEPLRGFSWRGGCARETTGIELWSQPFPVTLPTGEKVAVLLMDTQGSFDDQSSLRDCSLIFALSTLLASTQVYNISQKIKEDDLQHLQLFTEYAAAGGGGLAALRLLLRDWSAPYDFPYGAAGGARYLRDKLQVKEEQPRELRDIRQRLTASFEDMSCFLMPHPGLQAAADPNFQGKLSELTDEFKQSLRELVPLLLAPARLCVKRVAGRPLTARELPVFLQAYLDEFNTRVPTPLTALDATARAVWLCGREAARALVRAAVPARALPRASLRARLLAAARDALLPLPPLADRANELPALADFEKELDALVDQYAEINDRRMDLVIAEAKAFFESVVQGLEHQGLCLHPLDLSATLTEARNAAMVYFDCYVDEMVAADPDIAQLAKDLEERSEAVLERLSAVNAANNSSAVEAASAAASAALERALPRCCAGAADLAAAHADARRLAAHTFKQHRNRPTSQEHDDYLTQLERNIQLYLSKHTEQNAENNSNAKNEALEIYETSVNLNNGFWRPDLLAAKHEEVKELVINSFYDRRDGSNSRERDEFVMEIESELLCRYNGLREENEIMNERAVDEAYDTFCRNMDKLCGGLRLHDLYLLTELRKAYVKEKDDFLAKRVHAKPEIDNDEDDLYLQSLVEKIKGRFNEYRLRNSGHWTGLQVAGVVVGAVAVVGAGLAAAAAAGPAAVAAGTEAAANAALPAVVAVAAAVTKIFRG